MGQGTGETFDVTAADVVGSIQLGADGQSNADYYAITATAGELLNFQVLSQSLTRDDRKRDRFRADDLRSRRHRLSCRTTAAPPARSTTTASRTPTPSFYDLTMPYTGTYYVKVSTYAVTDSFGILHNSDLGNYELFMYSFAATAPGATPPANGDTLVGGSGQDTLMGSSANDLIEVVPGDSVDLRLGCQHDRHAAVRHHNRRPPAPGGKPRCPRRQLRGIEPGHGLHVRLARGRSNGQVIADARGTAAVNAGAGTTSFQFTPSAAGAYTITLTITDGYGGVNQATLAETAGTITPFTTQIGTGASQITGTSGTPIDLECDGHRHLLCCDLRLGRLGPARRDVARAGL